MTALYHIGIRLYTFLIFVAAAWNKKAAKWIRGRQHLSENIKNARDNDRQVIWFHCASLGEYEQALPLIDQCKVHFPRHQILTTFYSPSGYTYIEKKFPEAWISYLPIDTRAEMSSFIATVQPSMVFIVKYEFWYNMLYILHQRQIPVFLVSGIFRKNQLFFKSWSGFYKKIPGFFSHIFVQDTQSAALLAGIGIGQVTVGGDTRFDRVVENKDTPFHDKLISVFVDRANIFVAGSVWDSDIPVLQKIISVLPAEWKIIIAPHEPGHFSTHWINDAIDHYSKGIPPKSRVLLIDTIGLLSKLYRFARFAYVGGGFGKGIHNILEPAVYGIPVLIGPKFQKFLEAKALTAIGCVFVVDAENADQCVMQHIFNENDYNRISELMIAYIDEHSNVSEKIMVYVKGYLRGRNQVF